MLFSTILQSYETKCDFLHQVFNILFYFCQINHESLMGCDLSLDGKTKMRIEGKKYVAEHRSLSGHKMSACFQKNEVLKMGKITIVGKLNENYKL